MGSLTHKRISKTSVLVCILAGLLLSVMMVQFRLSGKLNLKRFYDVGPKYTVMYGAYTQSYEGLEYGADGNYHVTSDDCGIHIVISSEKNRHWNYLYLDVRNLETEKLTLQVISYKYNGKVVYDALTDIKEGMNEIPLGPKKSASAALRITNQKGASFRIQSMQFRKNQSFYGTKKALKMIAVCMAVYLAVFGLLYKLFLRRLRWERVYVCMDWLAFWYRKMTEWIANAMFIPSKRTRGKIRQICFCLMIFSMFWTENFGSYNKKNYYYCYLILNCLLILLIAIVSMEKEGREVKWRNPLMLSWFFYSVLICISDIIVPKKQMFTGGMLIVVFGLFYYAIARLKRPIVVLYDFMKAVEFSYAVTSALCILFRPIEKMIEGRYIGITIGPYSYAAYLVVVIAVFYAEIDRCILEKRKFLYLIFSCVGLISAYYFIWKTQSRAGMLAVCFCIICFFVRIFKMRRMKQYVIRSAGAAFLCIALAFPVLWLQDTAMHTVSEKLGTTLYFPNDYWMIGAPESGTAPENFPDETLMKNEYQIDFWGNYVYAEEAAYHHGLSSGRITIYKEYIGQLNLWGHKKDLYVDGRKYRAHNAILQVGYRYGIFTMIPYTVMLLYVIYYGSCYLKLYSIKKRRYALLPMILIVGCVMLMMLDNIERNFRYLPWVAFYVLIGFLSNQTNETDD